MSHKNPVKAMTDTLGVEKKNKNLGFSDDMQIHESNGFKKEGGKLSPMGGVKHNYGTENGLKVEVNVKRSGGLLPSISAITALQNCTGSTQQRVLLLNEVLATILCDMDQLHNFDYLFDEEMVNLLSDMQNLTYGKVASTQHYDLLTELLPNIIEQDLPLLKMLLCIVHDIRSMASSHSVNGFFYFQLPRDKIISIAEKHEEICAAEHIKTRMILKRKLYKMLKEELGCTLCLPIALVNCRKFVGIVNRCYALDLAINYLTAIESMKQQKALPNMEQGFFANNNKMYVLLYNLRGLSQQIKALPIAYLQENFSYLPWAALESLGDLWGSPLARTNNKGFDVRFFVHNVNEQVLQKITNDNPEVLDFNLNALLEELADIKTVLHITKNKLYKHPKEVFMQEFDESQAPATSVSSKMITPPYVFWHRNEIEVINNSCFAFMLSVAEWKKVLDGRGLFTNDMHQMVENLLKNVSDAEEKNVLMKIKQIENESLAYHVRRWGRKLPQDNASVLRFVQTIIKAYPESRDKWREHFMGHNRKMQLNFDELSAFKSKVSNDNSLSEYIEHMVSQLKPSPHQQLHDYIAKINSITQEVSSAEVLNNMKQMLMFCRTLLFQAAMDGKARALTKIISMRLPKGVSGSVPLLFDSLLPTDYQDSPKQYDDMKNRIYSAMADYLLDNAQAMEALLYSLNVMTTIFSEVAYEYFNVALNIIDFNNELSDLKYMTTRLHLSYQAAVGLPTRGQVFSLMINGSVLENLVCTIEKLYLHVVEIS